ncbi:MAG: hypothetical protein ABJO02_02320 [Reichenbachiella sp.]|uniref:hypothetical protein n=1 Tax=Reichenbachiella sp. TaxID=2184521 RepID=UPI002966D86E|nr:hypothetical protein [Reichenbachiella sp.]MDW3212077.1 hypothetical protein [Reichenbachiella sp.]
MESNEKDIEQFDLLEKQKGVEELKDIQDLDEWMKSLPLKEVGTNFTSTVIASALLAKKRHANFKLLVWLMVFFAGLIAASYFLIGSSGAELEITYLDQVKTQSLEMLDFMADPRLRQLFLVVEGIICLVIIEKLVSSFRILRHAA